jgi:hypothetical protein
MSAALRSTRCKGTSVLSQASIFSLLDGLANMLDYGSTMVFFRN